MQLAYLALLASVFFPIRKIFIGQYSFVTGEYSDFLTISFYLSLIFVILLFVLLLFKSRELPKPTKSLLLLGSLVFIAVFANYPYIYELNGYFLATFLILVVSYETFSLIEKHAPNYRLWGSRAFIIFALFESILAIYQFLAQKSVGLSKLGESILSTTYFGVAKIVSGGTFIRPYGTFPHPNVLGAFLICGVLVNIWLIIGEYRSNIRSLYFATLIPLSFTLILTFSRSSWIVALVGLIVFTSLYIGKYSINKKLTLSLLALLLSTVTAFFILKPIIIDRSSGFGESSSMREVYNKTALKMIGEYPIFGVGAGESMLHMQQFSPIRLNTWEIQPIHNYYLLSAAELGIPAALALMLFFIYHLIIAFRRFKYSSNVLHGTWNLLLGTVLLCFMILMLFDHYFYTLMQTQFLLWMVLGLIAAEIRENALHGKHKTEV